nr:MAG TPA: hypothetical protein [Caudoviricetes sp.]
MTKEQRTIRFKPISIQNAVSSDVSRKLTF